MINEEKLLTWWNKPIVWLFAIIFSPIGLLLWLIIALPPVLNGKKRFKDINHFGILMPGFYFGLIISFLIVGPFIMLGQWLMMSRYRKNHKRKYF